MKTTDPRGPAQVRSASEQAATADIADLDAFRQGRVLPLGRGECEAAIQALEGLTLLQERFLFLVLTLSRLRGYCWMQQAKMAEQLRVSVRSIETLMHWARAKGFLAEVERVGFYERRYHLDLVRLGIASGPVPADAVGRTRSWCGHSSDPPGEPPRRSKERAAAGPPPVDNAAAPPAVAAAPPPVPLPETPRYDAPSSGPPQRSRDGGIRGSEGTLADLVGKVVSQFEPREDLPRPSRGVHRSMPCALRGGAVQRPGLHKRTPPPDFDAELGLVRQVRALNGGESALKILEREKFTREGNDQVLTRVLEYDHEQGGIHAGKFVHSPIYDARARQHRIKERLENEKRDEVEERRDQRVPLYESKRAPKPPPDVRPPPRDPAKASAFAAQWLEEQRNKGNAWDDGPLAELARTQHPCRAG